jgi:NAD(P)-dependent dehydrogenase (short-subunit alcohol dehydrogenase family)
LAAHGYHVLLTARREEALAAAAESIGARWVAADATDPESFAQVAGAVAQVDLLIHAAGILDGTYVRSQSHETWSRVIASNLTSCHVVVTSLLPKMRPGSRIIFVSSMTAHEPEPSRSAYSAAKAGLNAFAGALAHEVDRDGIAVHVVTPGPVATPMLTGLQFSLFPLQADDVAQAALWLETLPPWIMVPEIELRAVTRGPFVPDPTVPVQRSPA